MTPPAGAAGRRGTGAQGDLRRDGGRFRNGEPRLPDLTVRATDLPELMDDPMCDPRRLAATFRRFAVINPLVGGWGSVWRLLLLPVLAPGIARAWRRPPVAGARAGVTAAPMRVLDLGCGGGDLARGLARRARRAGVAVEVVGVDPDERAIAAATRTTAPGVTFRVASSADLLAAGERFDVVVSNHVLHHLSDAERTTFLAESAALARRLVVHSDIRRSPAAYRSYALAAPLVAAGSFVLVDGLRSVRRSYTVRELAAVVPPAWEVVAGRPHRVLAVHHVAH